MSIDIITNGDFMSPNITGFSGYSNGVQYYSTFAQGEKDILQWLASDNISLQNNDNGITSFGYPDITLTSYQGLYQYCSIENTATLSQTMNFTRTGSYILSFLYCARPNYQLNNLQIFLNYKLLDVITVSQSNWTQYTYTFPVSTLGSYTLSFQGQGDYITETHIGIANIQLFAPNNIGIIGIVSTTVYNNNFKSTNINGSLSVIDYTDTSGNVTKGELTTNYFTCKNNLTLTKAINFSDGTTPVTTSYFGRILPSATQLLFDYYSCLSFRQCADKNFGTPVYKLNISNNGIVINSSTLTSTYPLDCNGIAIIRGVLTCTSDILYYNNVSISSAIKTLSGLVYNSSAPVVATISSNLISLSGLVYGTISNNINSLSGLVYGTISSNINSLSGVVYSTISNNIYSISGKVNTISSLVYGTISNNIYTISSLIYGTISNNINSVSGIVSGHTTSINTLTTKTTKIFYTLNNIFIGRDSNNNVLDFSDGGIIMNNTSPIYGKASGSTIYGGNGFFYNTNSFRRTDFVNIVGYSAAGNSTSLGGFEFWIHNYSNPAYVVTTIDCSGTMTLSGIVANNNVTSPILTATTKVITPYVTLNSLYNIGTSIILTALNGNNLTFPLPEMIFCNCSSNAINITLPDIASLPATATCKIIVRRIINTSNQVNVLAYGGQSKIYSNGNALAIASNAIGNCCQLLLCSNFWYVNFIN